MKKNLVFFTMDYVPKNFGGIGIHLYNLINNLKSTNNITIIWVKYLPNNNDDTQVILDNGVRVIKINGHYEEVQNYYGKSDHAIDLMVSIGTAYYITHEVENFIDFTEKNTIIHNHGNLFNFTCEYLKNKYNIPLISTIHYKSWEYKEDLYKSLQHSMLFSSDACICVSNWLYQTIIQLDESLKKKISIIHNGVSKSTSNHIDNVFEVGKFKICCVGALIYRKGIDRIIEAIDRSKYKDNIELYIIGNGSEKRNLVMMTENKHISANFLNDLENKKAREWMRKCHLVVMPSREETFSITALEALAEGRCLLASRLGGFLELISDGENGFLFSEINELSNKIDLLYENPKLINKVSKCAYETSKKYNWDKVALDTEIIYEKHINLLKNSNIAHI